MRSLNCGMFALAIWDETNKKLVLARDPLGIKPLYYFINDKQLIFASELRALLASGLLPRSLSAEGVNSYLANGSIESPLTIVSGVKQLLPGHCLEAKANSLESTLVRFSPPLGSSTPPKDRTEAVVGLRQELEESVRL